MAAVARGLVDDARIASCIVRSKFCYGDMLSTGETVLARRPLTLRKKPCAQWSGELLCQLHVCKQLPVSTWSVSLCRIFSAINTVQAWGRFCRTLRLARQWYRSLSANLTLLPPDEFLIPALLSTLSRFLLFSLGHFQHDIKLILVRPSDTHPVSNPFRHSFPTFRESSSRQISDLGRPDSLHCSTI